MKLLSCIGAIGLFPVSAFFFFDHEAYEAAGLLAIALMLAVLACGCSSERTPRQKEARAQKAIVDEARWSKLRLMRLKMRILR